MTEKQQRQEMDCQKQGIKSAPQNEFSDPGRVRRFKQVMEHYPSRVGLFRRVYLGQASPRQCIKAFCLECNGWETKAIGECCAPACPLWCVRPYQVKPEEVTP